MENKQEGFEQEIKKKVSLIDYIENNSREVVKPAEVTLPDDGSISIGSIILDRKDNKTFKLIFVNKKSRY